MLIKKELQNIPVQKPVFTKKSKTMRTEFEYINSYIYKREDSAEMFTADFYDSNKTLIRRFFSDGITGIIVEKNGTWNNRIINRGRYFNYLESKESFETTKKFLKGNSWESNSCVIINNFLSSLQRVKRSKYEEKKYDLMREHMELYPGIPEDFTEYCEEHVFDKRYVVFTNGKNGAECRCLHCEKIFKTKEKLKHKQQVGCPKCKSASIAIAKRWQNTTKDKAKMCIINNVDGNLITVWLEVKRKYCGDPAKITVDYDAYFFDILTSNGKRYYYKYNKQAFYWGSIWVRGKYPNTYDKAHLYVNNMADIYRDGITQYGLDLTRLADAGPIDFIRLINASATNKSTKTLYRLGLYNLASNAALLPDGDKFHEVLGVSKAYLPLLKKYNVTYAELKCLQLDKTLLKEEQFKKFVGIARNQKGGITSEALKKVLKYMTFEKAINYFYKQRAINNKATSTLADLYCDYIDMGLALNKILPKKKRIDTTTTMFRYPRDIKQAHDGMSAKLTVANNKIYNKAAKKLKKEYDAKFNFTKDGLVIVYPEDAEDFVREGTILSHCVGNNPHYITQYATEEEITVFIRKKEEPEKPYYTATFYTKDFSLRECYGKSHKTAPEGIKKFLESYKKFMREKYLKDKPTPKAA